MSRSNDGKYLEDETRDALKELSKRSPVKIDRIDDAKSAGQFTTNKAGDFMGCAKSIPWLIECKSSDMEETLRSCLSSTVKNTQAAHHRLWHRAGGRSIFIFYSLAYDNLEIWDGTLVCKHRVSGKPLPPGGALLAGGMGAFQSFLKTILIDQE